MTSAEALAVSQLPVAFLPDEDSIGPGRSIRRYKVLTYSDVGLARGAPDQKVAEHARAHRAIVLTRNIRDFLLVMRDAAEQSSAGDCRAMHCHEGGGLVTVHESVTAFNFERVTRKLTLNDLRIDWEEVYLLNLRVHIGPGESVTVSILHGCQVCRQGHAEECDRCEALGIRTA